MPLWCWMWRITEACCRVTEYRKLPEIAHANVLYALEPLTNSTSHSPQALAWGRGSLKAETVSTVLHRDSENSVAVSETVKTVAEFQRPM